MIPCKVLNRTLNFRAEFDFWVSNVVEFYLFPQKRGRDKWKNYRRLGLYVGP